MPEYFFSRLRNYYLDVATVLRGEANAASIFPNPTDIGMSRERVYAEFLKQHAPSRCNVFYGGFLFGDDGSESAQLDIIVTTDTTPQFNLHNSGHGKSFAPVEGTLAVASVKSSLNKSELEDALKNIATIPPTSPLENRINPLVYIKNYDDWPYKIIYASDGISAESLAIHLHNYYQKNPDIPWNRRPNIIHVSGKYVILRATDEMVIWDSDTLQSLPQKPGEFKLITNKPDLQGILWVLNDLQQKTTASTHINYSYFYLINRINDLP